MRLPHKLACFLCLLVAAVPGRCAEAPVGLDLESSQEPTAWTVLYQGKKVLVYSFAPQKFKPYVKELYTLRGENILRDAPFDHLHHHALAGHPSNPHGDAVFFSMLTPFAYLSATQRLDREPLVYRAGETFQLRYLALLYPDASPSESLRQHLEAWRKAVR